MAIPSATTPSPSGPSRRAAARVAPKFVSEETIWSALVQPTRRQEPTPCPLSLPRGDLKCLGLLRTGPRSRPVPRYSSTIRSRILLTRGSHDDAELPHPRRTQGRHDGTLRVPFAASASVHEPPQGAELLRVRGGAATLHRPRRFQRHQPKLGDQARCLPCPVRRRQRRSRGGRSLAAVSAVP